MSDSLKNLGEEIEKTATEAKDQVKGLFSSISGWFKDSKIWKFFQKWIVVIIAAVFIVAFIIILATSGIRFSIGKKTCIEVIKGNNKNDLTAILTKCEKDNRGDFILQFIDDNSDLVPEDFNIYKAIEYRETGKITNGAEPVREVEKPTKKNFMDKVLGR